MRGRLPLPPFPGQTAGGGVPAAPRRLAPTSFPGLPPAETPAAAHSRANRRGRRPRHPAKACAVANNNPCLPPWGKVAPQGRMRGGLPLPLIPGQTVGAASPTPRGGLRRRPSPGYHPRRLPLPPTPAEGSRPLPTDRTIDGCSRHPPGRACPAPTVRRPGNGCPRKPRGRFHIPIRRAGWGHPALRMGIWKRPRDLRGHPFPDRRTVGAGHARPGGVTQAPVNGSVRREGS